MSKVIKIKKGLDIKLKGAAEKVTVQSEKASEYAVKPLDFVGLTPKLKAKPGDAVKVGTPVFFDKYHPSIKFVSPVAGVVKEVVRGERRRILEVVIEVDEKQEYEAYASGNPAEMEPASIRENLLNSGLWPSLIQRPYGIVANPEDQPNDIFISGFDSAPLGVDFDMILKDQEESFAVGVAALQKLTTGKVHLSLKDGEPVTKAFAGLKDVEYHTFAGSHPAGLVGIQIHHISPINKGDLYWTINPQHVALIGKLFQTGKLNPEIVVAVSGSQLAKPRYVRTILGTALGSLLKDQGINVEESRIVSGNVLTGKAVGMNGFLGYFDSLVSVIPEGDQYEMFGWALPGLEKFSMSKTFFSWLMPKKKWDINTNLKGGARAFVMTGQYDKVLPMDILSVFLLKAILINDIDKMEQLGIYEVIEEDLALCEFVCTSKTEVQEILRGGLDTMFKEMS